MNRSVVASTIGFIAVLAWPAYGICAMYVEEKLIRFYGKHDLPQGEDRWNPAIYQHGAEVWIRRDRLLERWKYRAWFGLAVVAMGLAWLVLYV